MEKNTKIYIPGHRGLVGSAILRKLREAGCENLVFRTHQELDLTVQADVNVFFNKEQPEYVVLAAAKVGGILANNTYPAQFIYHNLTIQTHVLNAAWKTGVKRLLFLGSSCIYPRECPQPMREDYLLTGPLEPTNQPYAVAKIAGVIQCEAYNREYDTRFLAVMPTNLYGPNDNYDLENSHVIPALIRKFHLAKLAVQGDWEQIQRDEEKYGWIPGDIKANLAGIARFNGQDIPPAYRDLQGGNASGGITLWGSGRPRREFLYVDDLADACVFLVGLDNHDFSLLCADRQRFPLPLINIGTGCDQTVRELAAQIAEIVGYTGDVIWDSSKPDGPPQKLLDVAKLTDLGWKSSTSLSEGLRKTYGRYSGEN
ncbi:MAG: GDP-L-fucose synthase [Deltaproteobacteria bacterium]|nr:GDP-L-fucose synthase [Deltaproteobacteria bacterium]